MNPRNPVGSTVFETVRFGRSRTLPSSTLLPLNNAVDRTLLESALRIDFVGSIERFAEALQGGLEQAGAARIAALALRLGPRGLAAERRLAFIAHAAGMTYPVAESHAGSTIRLDPREKEVTWVDERFRVSWHLGVDQLRASVQN